jgi:hypothetical protein
VIHHAVVQGSEWWLRLRLGRPTASEFDKIITAKKWEPTKGGARRSYQVRLLTELILDGPLDNAVTPAMIHGTDFEAKALAAYEMLEGIETTPCGFCTTDDGMAGASADAFVGEDGSLEIKSPFKPEIHVGYLLNPESLKEEYWVQVQGQLYVTGRKWTDLISYFMGIPMARVRIEPYSEFQTKLHAALQSFLAEFRDLTELAVKRGVRFPERSHAVDHSRDWITEEDVERIIESQKVQEIR